VAEVQADESESRYHVEDIAAASPRREGMKMRCMQVLVLGGTLAAGFMGTAHADKFGGFSGIDRPYLVNQDRVCTPLRVAGGTASGAPSCAQAAADVVAKLSFKEPLLQSGPKATFAATASGRTITVTRKDSGTEVVTWSAIDPIGKIVEVYASQYGDRIAVVYMTKRAGREVTDVIAFDLGLGAGIGPTPPGPGKDPTAPADPTVKDPNAPANPAPPADPKLAAAVAAAQKAGPKALAAWKAVLALDASHSEALFCVAAAQLAAKQQADALATLAVLGASTRPDAIEWMVEARFDPAFAGVRADAKFRAAVGLDRKGTSMYERMMGFGGQWEQTGTACDKAEVRLNALRDRSFKLRVKTACQGNQFEMPFKGTWRIEGNRLVLTFPNKGKSVTAADESVCTFETSGDEDALKCSIGRDLEFTVLPTRR
jgi:hypothetical protein